MNTQGKTKREAEENLKDALQMILETRRMLAHKELRGAKVIRESLSMTR